MLGCLYRSPNSTDENTLEMYTLLKNETTHAFNKICILGDFNYPATKWQGEWTGDKDNELIECIRYAFLLQMMSKPTRTRVEQTCNILDLVIINNVSLISDIEHGRSAKAILRLYFVHCTLKLRLMMNMYMTYQKVIIRK